MQYVFWVIICVVAVAAALLLRELLNRSSSAFSRQPAARAAGRAAAPAAARRKPVQPGSPKTATYPLPDTPTAYETATFPDEDDGYVAANFYDEVAEILAASLDKQPERQDLRLKLLEVLSTAGRRDDFVQRAREFRDRMSGKDADNWQAVLRMAQTLFAGTDLLTTLLSDPDHIPEPTGEEAIKPGGKPKSRRFGESITDQAQLDALAQLHQDYENLGSDRGFLTEVDRTIDNYTGNHHPVLYHARRLSESLGGARIYLKREGQRLRGSHKLINAIGQGVMAQRLNKRLLVAGTVSGEHGLAVARTAAHLGLQAVIYMTPWTQQRAEYQLARMRLLGAQVNVLDGPARAAPGLYDSSHFNQALQQVRNSAMQHWVDNLDSSFFVNGLAAGPDPYPRILRDVHGIIGRTARNMLIRETGKLPTALICCVNGDIDAIGFFTPFIAYDSIRLVGAEQQIEDKPGQASADPYREGTRNLFSTPQVATADAILTGRGYPSTRREHQWLRETRRVHYVKVAKTQAQRACEQLAQTEGLLVSDDSAFALAVALRMAPRLDPERYITVQLSDSGEAPLSGLALT